MDAPVVSSWITFCQLLFPAFTAPSALTFLHLLTGWTLCRGRAVVTGFVCTIGASLLDHAAKHWTGYEKFFHRAAWEPDEVCRLLLQRVIEPLLKQQAGKDDDGAIDLLIDDTTADRCGNHVALAGYYKDASISNTRTKVVHWGHNWIIGVVAVSMARWPGWVMGLPALAALYRKSDDCDQTHPFMTRQQLAARLIHQTHQALPGRKIRVKADGQYATKEVAGACFEVDGLLISRLRGDSALFALPPQRRPGARGMPKRRGERLPTPKAMAKSTRGWQTIYLTDRHGRRVRRQIKSRVCLWWHVAKTHPIKVVIVKNPGGRDDYLFSTDATMSEKQIILGYDQRWPIEQAIGDAKQHDGLESMQGWCQRTVLRQAPLALIKQTLIKAWYIANAEELEKRPPLTQKPWRPPTTHPSYRDMLAALRLSLWQTRIKGFNSAPGGRVDPNLAPLQYALCEAA